MVAICVALGICYLLWTPAQRSRAPFWVGFLNNGGHAVLFALQTWPLLLGVPRAGRARVACLLVVLGFAAVTEWVQNSVGRDGTVGDFVTDAFGVYFAWATVRVAEHAAKEARVARSALVHAGLAVVFATLSALVETLRR